MLGMITYVGFDKIYFLSKQNFLDMKVDLVIKK